MKKTLLLALKMLVVLTLAGCQSASPPANPTITPKSEEELSTPKATSEEDEQGLEMPGSTEDAEGSRNITIMINDIAVTAELYDSEIARQFISILPQTISMTRGRDREYYGRIDGALDYNEGDIQTFAEDGDLAYWFSGNSLAFFFNTENDSVVNSGIVVFGKITSDLTVFDDMDGSMMMTVALSE